MRHIPPGYVGILTKIDKIGRAKYGDDWRGDKVAELRAAIPAEVSSTPPPIRSLGQGPSGRPASKTCWVPPSPEQRARYSQERKAAEQQVTEAANQRDATIGELKKWLWRAEEIAYELLADGSLSPLPIYWAYSDAAAGTFLAGVTEHGRPVFLEETAEKSAAVGIAKSPADNVSRTMEEQVSNEASPDDAAGATKEPLPDAPTKCPPILSKQQRRAALLAWGKTKFAEILKRISNGDAKAAPLIPNRDELKELGRDEVAANVNEGDARWLRSKLLPKELTKGGAGFHKKRSV
jgi:hypothetical protein